MDLYSDISDEESDSSAVVEVKQQQHCTFAEEAFTYLLGHFGIREKPQSRFRYFSDVAGQAVVTIAYAYRKRLRTLFRSASVNFGDVDELKEFVLNFELIEDEIYFYRVLKKISHIFELVVYCLSEGHDHIGTAREIDLFVGSAEYFEVAGGLSRLNKTAAFIADVGMVLHAAIKDEKPQDVVLRSFEAVVQALENPDGGEMPPTKRGMLSVIKRQIHNKFPDINDLDVRVARVFYQVICQHTSRVIAVSRRSRVDNMYWRNKEYVGIEREKEAIIESLRIAVRIIFGQTDFLNLGPPVKLAECFAALRHLTDLISPVLDNPQAAIPEHVIPSPLSEDERKCYSVKECFIVSSDYVTERQLVTPPGVNEVPESLFEQPSVKKLHQKSLKKVVDANIQQDNCFQLSDGRYVVHTPDCTFDDTTTTVLYN